MLQLFFVSLKLLFLVLPSSYLLSSDHLLLKDMFIIVCPFLTYSDEFKCLFHFFPVILIYFYIPVKPVLNWGYAHKVVTPTQML